VSFDTQLAATVLWNNNLLVELLPLRAGLNLEHELRTLPTDSPHDLGLPTLHDEGANLGLLHALDPLRETVGRGETGGDLPAVALRHDTATRGETKRARGLTSPSRRMRIRTRHVRAAAGRHANGCLADLLAVVRVAVEAHLVIARLQATDIEAERSRPHLTVEDPPHGRVVLQRVVAVALANSTNVDGVVVDAVGVDDVEHPHVDQGETTDGVARSGNPGRELVRSGRTADTRRVIGVRPGLGDFSGVHVDRVDPDVRSTTSRVGLVGAHASAHAVEVPGDAVARDLGVPRLILRDSAGVVEHRLGRRATGTRVGGRRRDDQQADHHGSERSENHTSQRSCCLTHVAFPLLEESWV
jgi:hypothetical protein